MTECSLSRFLCFEKGRLVILVLPSWLMIHQLYAYYSWFFKKNNIPRASAISSYVDIFWVIHVLSCWKRFYFRKIVILSFIYWSRKATAFFSPQGDGTRGGKLLPCYYFCYMPSLRTGALSFSILFYCLITKMDLIVLLIGFLCPPRILHHP